MTTTSEAGQNSLALYTELKAQVDLLSEQLKAAMGIAHHADEIAEEASAIAKQTQQRLEAIAPLKAVDGDTQAIAALFGATDEAAKIEGGGEMGNSYTGRI